MSIVDSNFNNNLNRNVLIEKNDRQSDIENINNRNKTAISL